MSFPVPSKTGLNPFTTQGSNVQKAKPRGGWDDEDNDLFTNPNITFTGTNVTQLVKPSLNIATGNKIFTEPAKVIEHVESEKKSSILACDDAFFKSHAHEAKVISEHVQPGGARLKQSDAVLLDFCRACDSMQIDVVGSILFNNLNSSIGFISKAKTLYLIEALVRKIKKYNGYFNHNQRTLASYNFAEEGNVNANQLRKIRDDIVNYLTGQVKTPQVHVQQTFTPVTAVSTTKQMNTPNQPQSAQVNPVGLNLNTGPIPVTGAKKTSTVPAQLLNTQAQPTSNQAPSTAHQLPSQSKPNPFGITSNAQPNSAIVTKPSSGLPGSFKKMLNKNSEASVVSPSNASSQNSIQTPVSAQPQNLLSNQLSSQQAVQSPQEPANNIINALAGLNFNEQESQQNFNGGYPVYPNQYGYNTQNYGPGPSYPQVQDPSMMGYPGHGQYNYPPQAPYNNYPNSQFNGQFNGPYNGQQFPPQFNPQFQGQFQEQVPQYYDPGMNYQMQGAPQQGQMYHQAQPVNQSDFSELDFISEDQPNAEQEEANREEMRKKEQQRLEELQRKKQQQENEKRFESLNYML